MKQLHATSLLLGMLTGILTCAFAARAAGVAGEPFLVDTKVQVDLENELSRILPREQFLVQVNSEIVTRSERRMVEGETITVRPIPTRPAVQTMPGFLPEPELTPPPAPPQDREVYRIVETPVLNSVIVHVSFDETVTLDAITRAKAMVQSYMQENYPNKAVITFNQIPMLQPKKKADDTADKPKPKEPEPTEEEKLWNLARWAILGLLILMMLMLWQGRNTPVMAMPAPAPRRRPKPEGEDASVANAAPNMARALNGLKQAFSRPDFEKEMDEEEIYEARRRKLLGKFLIKSEAFRIYYTRLSDEEKAILCAGLKGQAMESLLDGLGLPIIPGAEGDASQLDERLEFHEKSFDEFAQAKDWQDRQFFGFLQQLGDEQLTELATHESPLAVCLMLRYMKPNQSARVLDSLESQKRVEVLSHLPEVNGLSLSKMAAIERELRNAVTRLPQHAFGAGKEDVEFWGEILSESNDQDAILKDLENTHPEIYPQLAKYRFKLEDAATLPDGILERVLSDVENDELGMALATCSEDVVDVILEAVSPRRRELMRNQVVSFRGMSAQQTNAARLKLTKRFRDAMAG